MGIGKQMQAFQILFEGGRRNLSLKKTGMETEGFCVPVERFSTCQVIFS